MEDEKLNDPTDKKREVSPFDKRSDKIRFNSPRNTAAYIAKREKRANYGNGNLDSVEVELPPANTEKDRKLGRERGSQSKQHGNKESRLGDAYIS